MNDQLLLLINSAADCLHVSTDDIQHKKSRKRDLTDARHIICHIAQRVAHINTSLESLSINTGRADHSGSFNSIMRAEDLLFCDDAFQKKYKSVVNRFNELSLNHIS